MHVVADDTRAAPTRRQPECIKFLRALGIHDHRITLELHNAVLTAVFESSEVSRKSSDAYWRLT
jgi:hypothetical protein